MSGSESPFLASPFIKELLTQHGQLILVPFCIAVVRELAIPLVRRANNRLGR